MVDVTLKVPALEKLVDYAASGIGAVAGTMLAPWKARKEAEARLIMARADADSTKRIADAQAEARHSLAVPDQAGRRVLEIDRDGIRQRFEFQEGKRQANITSVVWKPQPISATSRSRLMSPIPTGRRGSLKAFRTSRRRHAKDLGENSVGGSRGAGTDIVAYAFNPKGYVAKRLRRLSRP